MSTTIVTGCCGAIGKAICSSLAATGGRVVGVDHPDASSPPESVADFIPCDLADESATQNLVARLSTLPGITGLVNNAGYYRPITFFDTTLEDYNRFMAVNVRAVFQLSQGIARAIMVAQTGGAIVNIASIAGKLGSPVVPYGTSKAAVIGLTRSTARVLAPHNIRVNAVAPGVIDTPMSAAVSPEQMRHQLLNVPMGRTGQPVEIARTVKFLLSEEASYMTGAVVDVAGGWMS